MGDKLREIVFLISSNFFQKMRDENEEGRKKKGVFGGLLGWLRNRLGGILLMIFLMIFPVNW